MRIPSKREIEKNFRKDVSLKSWREKNPAWTLELKDEKAEVLKYFTGLIREHNLVRKKEIKKIKSLNDLKKRAAKTKKVILEVQGLEKLPEKTPLKPVITGSFYKDDLYKVEKIVFESRPNYYVTANMYVPLNILPPFPAVLFVLGHSQNGKAHPKYQKYCATLAANGIAVLIFDCAGQGERDEYVDIKTGKRTIGRACRMHGVAGDPVYLTGKNFGGYRLGDAVRALDYLTSREEIDKNSIGVTGMSGGGWESLWLAAIDKRIKAVYSGVYTTTLLRRIENRAADAEPDPEQDPFGFIGENMDIGDVIMASAPAAVALCILDKDFFPVDGARKTYNEAKKVYMKCKIGDRIKAGYFHGGHGADAPGRMEFCISWMKKWLKNEADAPKLIEFTPEKDEKLYAVKNGIVLSTLGGKATAEMNALDARELAVKRQKQKISVREKLFELLKPGESSGVTKKVSIRSVKGLKVEKFKLASEGKLFASAYIWSNPEKVTGKGIVYLTEKPELYNPYKEKFCLNEAKRGNIVIDLIPVGMEPFKETYMDFVPLTEADLSYDAFLLGKTLTGMRVGDVLRAVSLLSASGISNIEIYGKDYGALLGLFAAGLDERVSALTEVTGLTSLSSICYNREYAYPVSYIIPGILKYMDLNDIRKSILPRKIMLDTPVNHVKKPMTLGELKAEA